MKLELSSSKNLIISELSRIPEVAGNSGTNPPALAKEAALTTSATFQINRTKFYVPVIT